MLAGAVALKNSKVTPWGVMKEREGFVTKFKVPTILESKMTFSMAGRSEFDKSTGSFVPKEQPYSPPKDHVFRDLELKFNQKDFVRQLRGDPAYNPNNLSEFNSLPQTTYRKERILNEAIV
jgi:hypothetical protein